MWERERWREEEREMECMWRSDGDFVELVSSSAITAAPGLNSGHEA